MKREKRTAEKDEDAEGKVNEVKPESNADGAATSNAVGLVHADMPTASSDNGAGAYLHAHREY
jgi:hypothetical protein